MVVLIFPVREKMEKSEAGDSGTVKATVSLSRKMSKVGLLAAMKTFTKPHFQRKKKTKEKAVSRSWDSGLCNVGLTPSPSGGQGGLGTVGSYKRIYWPGQVVWVFGESKQCEKRRHPDVKGYQIHSFDRWDQQL